MVYPDKSQYMKIAETYNIIPVYREYMADTETPTSIFLKCGGLEKKGFLLESIEGSKTLSRYSIVGVGCRKMIKVQNGIFSLNIDGEDTLRAKTSRPLAEIENILKDYRLFKNPGLDHFIGGAVGYLSYDLVKYFENISLPANSLGLPEILLYLTDQVVVFDHLLNRLKIISTIKAGPEMPPSTAYDISVENIEATEEKIRKNQASSFGGGIYSSEDNGPAGFEPDSNFEKKDFLAAIEKAKSQINEGEVFQVVLSQRFSITTSRSPLSIYRGLRSINPSPYMYFFNLGDFNIIGASPEPLVKINGREVFVCPIAGTRKRGNSPEEEKEIEFELLNDKKEVAEHNMLVDLARNDLGRICKYGSVSVKEYMNVEKYSHVMHIVSRVEGMLDENTTIYDALRSVFPAGTLSGAPKIRAMQIISELEPDCRGPYGGAVGYFGYDGNLDSCITIRTAVVKGSKVYIQAGAGIVSDSTPENEFNETLNKAAALFNAIRLSR